MKTAVIIMSFTTNLARPQTSAIITVRVIKSFDFRTERSLVIREINLETTTIGNLKTIVRDAIQTQAGWKPYRSASFDTLKLYTQAHGAKTTNLIINLDHDDWIFSDESKTLAESGFENETEVSFFNKDMYETFKLDPQTRWES
ncbi:cytoplasmic protein [Lactarius hengduanensis]|nr:cytoplasmic protein [Lactarius pseudohatsudake]KAH9025187.1 cytoplasmic protein [Lactarius pseudohatsudake]KAH9048064.1 cytoplasmic protein [Lactarius hengduanensis]